MENFILDRDIKVMCITAESFPAGIQAAHQKLHACGAFSPGKNYFGISYPDQGKIIYKAAMEESETGEAEKLGLEIFTISRGNYISVILTDYIKDLPKISKVFGELTSYPGIDPHGACVEWYINGGKDMRCMVRLDD
jgi:hypothetical protein